jgi:NAD(P)-dependent dehydrogenase (short-subunit alcohol dehydrogenase family)
MLLQDKVAVIYGAGGAVGGAVARAFAREGATLFLTGRHRAPVEPRAKASGMTLEQFQEVGASRTHTRRLRRSRSWQTWRPSWRPTRRAG